MQRSGGDVDLFQQDLWDGDLPAYDLELHVTGQLLSTYASDIDLRVRHLQARIRGFLYRSAGLSGSAAVLRSFVMSGQLHSSPLAHQVSERERSLLERRIGLGCNADPTKGPTLQNPRFLHRSADELPAGWSLTVSARGEAQFVHVDGRQLSKHPFHDDGILIFGSEFDLTTEFLLHRKETASSSGTRPFRQMPHTYHTLALSNACHRSRTSDYPDSCWLEEPSSAQAAGLCHICAHIDFRSLWMHSDFYGRVLFQTLLTLDLRDVSCTFCQLLWRSALSVVTEDWMQTASSNGVEMHMRFVVFSTQPSSSFFGEAIFYLGKQVLGIVQLIRAVERDSVSPWFLPDWGRPKYHATGDRIDCDLFRRWLSHTNPPSESHHELAERNADAGQAQSVDVHLSPSRGLTRLTVIDVQNACLVDIPPRSNYVALSYVWGGPQPFTNNSSTRVALYAAGSLGHRVTVPKTIRDAIQFVHSLGERYLCVDSLCIIQDDQDDKFEKIYSMDQIYASSRFTLIAAYGSSCHAGLPGVDEGSRVSSWCSLHGTQVSIEPPHFEAVLRRSTWITRGWTFQEWQLSKRCIIFTENEVFLRDGPAMARESTTPPPREADVSQAVFYDLEHGLSMSDYVVMVSLYTFRTLSSSADKLNAFRGVERLFEPFMHSEFLWGLPERQLDSALLWKASAWPAVRLPHFPSWSWCGWDVQVLPYHTGFGDEVYRLQWQDPLTKTFFVSSSVLLDYADQPRTYSGLSGKWTMNATKDEQRSGLASGLAQDPSPKRHFNTGHDQVLRFKALLAMMRLRNMVSQWPGRQAEGKWMCVIGPDGFDAGCLRLDSEVFDNSSDSALFDAELVCVSRCRSEDVNPYFKNTQIRPSSQIAGAESDDGKEIPKHAELYPRQFNANPGARKLLTGHERYAPEGFDKCRYNARMPFPLYNVLLIVRRADGIAERRGIGTVHITAFWQTKPQWRFVELG